MSLSKMYEWKEDEDSIILSIPFHGKSLKRTDLVIFDTLIKISHPPNYRLEIMLKHSIHDSSSRAIIKDDTLIMYLSKEVSGLWGTLEFHGTKEDCKERRRISLLKWEEQSQLRHQNAMIKKREEQRSTVQCQMNLEKVERQRIEDRKALHKQQAENDVYEALSKLPNSTTKAVKIEEEESSTLMHKSTESIDPCHVPPLRTRTTVSIINTPRWFKTPSRESSAQSEANFISKHSSLFMKDEHHHRHSVDENPLQLKEKGDGFYENKDFLSAINAYTPLLQYNDTKVHALIHRSDCYLQVGDVTYCIHDCEQLFQILDEGTESVFTQHESTDKRRGSIYMQLGRAYCQYNATTTDFDKALEYIQKAQDTANGIRVDDECIQRVERLQRAHNVKKEGDDFIQNGCIELAVAKYQEALSIDETLFTAAANMAAALFTLGKYEDCVQYCNHVLDLFTKEKNWSGSDAWYVPPPASKMRGKVMAALESRREIALKELRDDHLRTC